MTIVDPYSTKIKEIYYADRAVRYRVSRMFAIYHSQFNIIEKRKPCYSYRLASLYCSPEQHTGNVNDCGVLVCLYSWKILTVAPLPTKP